MSDDGQEESVATADLAVGDTVLIRPGERVGADGRVLHGVSDVDQATITGEPLPAAKGAGDEVFAGTLNGSGALRVKVERDASDSVIARIVAMVEEASATKAPTQLFIEKIEQRYSLGMVAATLAVFTVPLAFGAGTAAGPRWPTGPRQAREPGYADAAPPSGRPPTRAVRNAGAGQKA